MYLGKEREGVLSVVFFWTLVPGLLGIVESARYLLVDDEESDARYLD